MKRLVILLSILIFFFLTAFEKGYKDEIFIEKYRPIYGKWQFQFSVGETGFISGDYTIEFIKYGLFRYKDGKEGKIKIAQQDESTLLLDFDSLIPNVRYATVSITNSGDSLGFTPNNGISSLYTRIK